MDNLKYYLFLFQLQCFLVDIHITLLMRPQPLHPLPAGFCTGSLAYFGLLSCHQLMTILVALIATEVTALAMCFLRKFLVFRRMKRAHISIKTIASVLFCLAMFIVFKVSNLGSCGLAEDEEFRLIMENYASYLQSFRNLQNFSIYSRISQLATSTIFLLPIGILAGLSLADVEYSQDTTRILLVMFSTHASVNVIVLVFTTPPFRKFTLRRTSMVVSIMSTRHHSIAH
ncbi:Protein CBG04836 [Caenorhabditis briggsae]|uniref:Protein CBG04836 n=1 Tax=Caenorhabditis briggsae TaxID=6238 RepID=A8WYL1_CAEBR|nr:Protein CBG04836 [Caenorhabditis briggsae]CAP25469.2 Protein CBG04836 [Caenorhabditis briggsae]